MVAPATAEMAEIECEVQYSRVIQLNTGARTKI